MATSTMDHPINDLKIPSDHRRRSTNRSVSKSTSDFDKIVPVTFRFRALLNKNVKAYALQHDRTQNDVVEEAVVRYLESNGVNVNAGPQISWKRGA